MQLRIYSYYQRSYIISDITDLHLASSRNHNPHVYMLFAECVLTDLSLVSSFADLHHHTTKVPETTVYGELRLLGGTIHLFSLTYIYTNAVYTIRYGRLKTRPAFNTKQIWKVTNLSVVYPFHNR